MAEQFGVLFVCLGNICRSPMAKWVFRDLVERRGLEMRVRIDSCGTGGWHVGQPADPRAVRTAAAAGLRTDHVVRQLSREDFEQFDLLIAMDRRNREHLLSEGAHEDKVHLMRRFDPDITGAHEHALDVPDPYYGADDGFVKVHQMLRSASEGLLEHVRARLGS